MGKKEIIGKCHICGNVGKLSYEHVPPASAFNKSSTKVYKAIDVIKGKGLPWEVEGLKGTILQRGAGGYTLCEGCNSFTGAKYARDFISACDQAVNSGRVEINRNDGIARLGLLNINPVSFGKQIIAMFASVNHAELFDSCQDLRKLVLNENFTGIDTKKYALFMYLYEGGVSRQSGISIAMRPAGSIKSSELTTMPFGFVLVFDPDRSILTNIGTEITSLFNDFEPKDIKNIFFELPLYTQNSPLPLDFRTRKDILRKMQENKE